MTQPRSTYTGASIAFALAGLALDLYIRHGDKPTDLNAAREHIRNLVRAGDATGSDIAVECEELFEVLTEWLQKVEEHAGRQAAQQTSS